MSLTKPIFKPFLQRLAAPTDTASLVLLRVSFGLLMLWEVIRFFYFGWVDELYAQPTFHFKYEWFTWVEAWPGYGMHLHFAALGVLAVLIALGLFYRVATLLFFLGYTYIFLIDTSYYNNHFYLICLLSFLLVLAPLHWSWSLDALRGAVAHTEHLPALWLWLFRLQLGVVYFYGGIAKLDPDWLNSRAPEGLLRAAHQDTILEPIMGIFWVPYLYGWTGLLFDLLIPFGMLLPQTRMVFFIAAIVFHVHNHFVFSIGIFPALALALTLLYFNPNFPRRLVPNHLKPQINNWYRQRLGRPRTSNAGLPVRPVMILLGLYLSWQLLMPFRHWLTPGWTTWHEVGHQFSWRMMLRQKHITLTMYVVHPNTGEQRYAPPEDYLNPSQLRAMGGNPNRILQFAHYLRDLVQKNAGFTPLIHADIEIALNGRVPIRLVSPDLDLVKVPPFTPAYQWVNPYPREPAN
jgi:hypothetical protein